MKKALRMLLALALVLCLVPTALADTTIDGYAKRKIKLKKVSDNEVIEGISPTTGLTLADMEQPEGFTGLAITGRYLPMLVQIDNYDGGVGDYAPWGATYADIFYETPLHKSGFTRLSFLYSDLIPDSAGPVRSARVGHAELREEWDAGFLFYGMQKYAKANVDDVFKKNKTSKKGVLFSGMVSAGKPWKQYYTRRSGVKGPHNVDANVAAMSELVPVEHVAPNHAFKFTDELPTTGEVAEEITLDWGAVKYNSRFTYDADSNLYYRYMLMKGDEEVAYEDRDTQEHLAFSNLIVQHTKVKWVRSDAPLTTHIGEGNADIFVGGRYIAGYWKRDGNNRTVFYDDQGQEIELQRGKTFISIVPEKTTVSYK